MAVAPASMPSDDLDTVIAAARACSHCAALLPQPPRPVLAAAVDARILIIGQAPGARVHASGIPFDDASGDRLRDWLGVSRDLFYDARRVAIVPMGLCYPGRGRSGDLPPRPECAPLWHPPLLNTMKRVELTILVGDHAQRYYLDHRHRSLTERVHGWRVYWPDTMPLPHPSPRNNPWLRRNPWFEREVLPALRRRVRQVLSAPS